MLESPFALRGVIEGFYGTYYTVQERNDLVRFLGRHGFNFYAYGPKNDRQHRMRWWEPYPTDVMRQFGRTIGIAGDAGVRFCYTISFGVPPSYASVEDFTVVTAKLHGFYDLGCRAFGVLLDDSPTGFAHDANRKAFSTVAAAHADFCNRTLDWIGTLPEPCSLLLTPTEYFGVPPFTEYLHDLGRLLDSEIAICYTGRDICVPTITVADVDAFARVMGRKPIVWDNYPVNDLQMRPQLHLGPLEGRDPGLPEHVVGMMFNPMLQPEASKIPLLTIAEYLSNPQAYEPWEAWERALRAIAGERGYPPVRVFAENCMGSCLHPEEAPLLDALTVDALSSIRAGEPAGSSGAAAELNSYLDQVDDAIYSIRNRISNVSLRQNILPWVESLDEKVWLGRRSLALVQALEQGSDVSGLAAGVQESLREVISNPRSVGGTELTQLGEYARDLARDVRAGDAADAPGTASTDYGGAAFAADR